MKILTEKSTKSSISNKIDKEIKIMEKRKHIPTKKKLSKKLNVQ